MRGLVTGWLPVAAMALALSGSAANMAAAPSDPSEFHFVRMMYSDNGYRPCGPGWRQQDWPDAEDNFLPNLTRLTRIRVGEPVVLPLTDEHLFDYPWLYATQTGDWDLSDVELEHLREYLLRACFRTGPWSSCMARPPCCTWCTASMSSRRFPACATCDS